MSFARAVCVRLAFFLAVLIFFGQSTEFGFIQWDIPEQLRRVTFLSVTISLGFGFLTSSLGGAYGVRVSMDC